MTAPRYRLGLAYHAGGDFMSLGIQDVETGDVYPLGDEEVARVTVDALNDGMPNPLMRGFALTFKTFEEATEL